MDDWLLLKSYGRDESQDAFTEIVRRHVNLVYSAALRQVREAELARDVTQLVFANLARRAQSLKPKGTLAGWLYTDASFTSREILRRDAAEWFVSRKPSPKNLPQTFAPCGNSMV